MLARIVTGAAILMGAISTLYVDTAAAQGAIDNSALSSPGFR